MLSLLNSFCVLVSCMFFYCCHIAHTATTNYEDKERIKSYIKQNIITLAYKGPNGEGVYCDPRKNVYGSVENLLGYCARESRKFLEWYFGIKMNRVPSAKYFGSTIKPFGYKPIKDEEVKENGFKDFGIIL